MAKRYVDEDAAEVLPAWFLPRMMEDNWSFAFLMDNGVTVHLSNIRAVSVAENGDIWLDVELKEIGHIPPTWHGTTHLGAPTTRTEASINARHIVMAVETADT